MLLQILGKMLTDRDVYHRRSRMKEKNSDIFILAKSIWVNLSKPIENVSKPHFIRTLKRVKIITIILKINNLFSVTLFS